jgi:hypothetical protein
MLNCQCPPAVGPSSYCWTVWSKKPPAIAGREVRAEQDRQ